MMFDPQKGYTKLETIILAISWIGAAYLALRILNYFIGGF